MAAKYNLQANEFILLKEDSATYQNGFRNSGSGELILTNQNLVLVKRSTFGVGGGILTFPVNQIKVYNGSAQVVTGDYGKLEIYFNNGVETFSVYAPNKRAREQKVAQWVAKINEAVTGEVTAVAQQAHGLAIPGTEMVAGVLKDTFGAFKSKFAAAPAAPLQINTKCSSCGAGLAGLQGQSAACGYCGSSQQL